MTEAEADEALTEWADEPDTGIIEAMLDSDPPAAEAMARRKLHAIAKRPTPSSLPASELPTNPGRKA